MSDFPNFFTKAPNSQNALDLFKGEWSTRLPDSCGLVASTGPVRACEDYRIEWFEKFVSGGFKGKSVLELGPLEAGHSYMLQHAGADSITAIEGNSRSYLKCLIMKEVFGLENVHFQLGDFVSFLQQNKETVYDILLASGVVYHQEDPVRLISLFENRAKYLLIWTHYYDIQFMATHPELACHFNTTPEYRKVEGFGHSLYRKRYDEALEWKGFCGGGAISASWLPKEDLLAAIEHFGYKILSTWDERDNGVPKNVNGPSILVAAERK